MLTVKKEFLTKSDHTGNISMMVIMVITEMRMAFQVFARFLYTVYHSSVYISIPILHTMVAPGCSYAYPSSTLYDSVGMYLMGHVGLVAITGLYSERPRGAGFRSVNPAERRRENPARALA